LYEFESYAASAEVFIRIGVVVSFGVEDGNGWGQFRPGHVMVADDEVDAFFFGIGYFFGCLYAAIENDDESYSCFIGIVYAFA
jgi:hypothetical protein